jgi:4-hydroxyphenylpyruvate dioxygenase
MAQQTAHVPATRPDGEDFMPLNGVDHVELYVGNALQAAYYYTRAFGFREVAYAGLETGTRDRASHVLQQGRIRLVLTGALHADSAIAAHQHRHGDGVKVIALSVPSVANAYREATARGADGLAEPYELSDEHGTVRLATIRTYGETVHTFVERGGYDGPFLPGYRAVRNGTEDSGMHFSDDDISTEYSALMSKVVTDGRGVVKFPLNEPAEGKRKSQIDEYLEFYEGAGAQHIAVATRDIVATVTEMRRRGVEFLTIPEAYYDEVPVRVPEVTEQLADLREQGILVDRDDEGYLLQIFTKPVGDRPTVFFEVIERHGARGFGDGNFKALFEAIEREQERRGNL